MPEPSNTQNQRANPTNTNPLDNSFFKKIQQLFDSTPAQVKLPKVDNNTYQQLIIRRPKARKIEEMDSIKESLKKVLSVFKLPKIVQNNRLNWWKLEINSMSGLNIEYLDLSGLESLTDFAVYSLYKFFKLNQKSFKQIKFNSIKLNACRHITFWSLHYLAQIADKSFLDLHTLESGDFPVSLFVKSKKYLN